MHICVTRVWVIQYDSDNLDDLVTVIFFPGIHTHILLKTTSIGTDSVISH